MLHRGKSNLNTEVALFHFNTIINLPTIDREVIQVKMSVLVRTFLLGCVKEVRIDCGEPGKLRVHLVAERFGVHQAAEYLVLRSLHTQIPLPGRCLSERTGGEVIAFIATEHSGAELQSRLNLLSLELAAYGVPVAIHWPSQPSPQ